MTRPVNQFTHWLGAAMLASALSSVTALASSRADTITVAPDLQAALDTDSLDHVEDVVVIDTMSVTPDWRLVLRPDSLARIGNVVVIDTLDRRNLLGQIHLANVVGTSTQETSWALQSLLEGMAEYTSLDARPARRLTYSSRDLSKTPWVLMAVERYQFTGSDLRNLGRYMQGGGFILLDGGVDIGGEADVFARTMITQALGKVGERVRFRRLSKRHAIYHSFLDFDHPPLAPTAGGRRIDYQVGVQLGERWVAVISYAGLLEVLGGRSQQDVTRHLQLGINTILFAVTQEGGLTRRVWR